MPSKSVLENIYCVREYSDGKNALSSARPILRGRWTVTAPFTRRHSGLYTMRFIPDAGTVTYGRRDFMIHGDSVEHPGRASNGCIILRGDIRRRM